MAPSEVELYLRRCDDPSFSEHADPEMHHCPAKGLRRGMAPVVTQLLDLWLILEVGSTPGQDVDTRLRQRRISQDLAHTHWSDATRTRDRVG